MTDKLNADEVNIGLPSSLSTMVQATFELLHGRDPGIEVRGTKGIAIDLEEAALIREGGQAHLVIRLGPNAISVLQFHASNPLVQALDGMFTDFGPSRQEEHEAGQAERDRRLRAGELPPGYRRGGDAAPKRPIIPLYETHRG